MRINWNDTADSYRPQPHEEVIIFQDFKSPYMTIRWREPYKKTDGTESKECYWKWISYPEDHQPKEPTSVSFICPGDEYVKAWAYKPQDPEREIMKFRPIFNEPVKGAKPCPFCGEYDIVRNQLRFADSTQENMTHKDGTGKWTYIECSRCGIHTGSYCYEHTSLEHWNNREKRKPDKGGQEYCNDCIHAEMCSWYGTEGCEWRNTGEEEKAK